MKGKIKNIDICITGWGVPKFTARVLENANRLKLIAHTGGTVANFVSDELYAKGVRVVSANKIFAESAHMGGPTVDRRKYATLAVLDDIDNFINSRPLIHEITVERAARMTEV